jgi:zinc protease
MSVISRRFSLLCFLLFCLAVPSFAQNAQKQTLSNGLTVLVQENHAAPVVAVRFYVQTGSIYEGEYAGTGISHLFEHVLQEGSKTRTKQQINAETQAIGGQTNAYTSNDVTAYHIVTAAPYFNRALENLADSLMNATFPEAEVKIQQGIIHHEMNMGEDDPNRILWRTFYETAFIRHPARLPVIGYREAFDALTRDDILSYYNTHYTPENTILAVAGDVNAADVFAAAKKALGDWPRRAATTSAIADEPRQIVPRRAVFEKAAMQNALAMLGWHTVPLQHPDLYALDVLARILGGGETSRLTQALREKQELVYNVSAFSFTPDYNAGIFAINAALPPEKLPQLENAVWNEINKIKTSGVTAAELKRAQRGIETDYVFDTDVAEQAERMAYDFMGTGNPDFSDQYVARINAVTAAQVQAVTKKYLLQNGLTTAIVRPPHAGSTPKATTKKQIVAPPQMFTLENGLRVIIRENNQSPTVAIAAIGLDGLRAEAPGKNGVANIAADLLLRGTQKRSALEFSQVVDDMGAAISSGSGYNAWTVSSNWLARDWRRGLSLVHEALTMPRFSEDELRREKTLVAAAIKEQEDDPDAVAALAARSAFFGAHPYGRSTLGTLDSIEQISREDVVAHWNRVLNPRQMVLAIYGDVDAAKALKVAKYLFGDLKAKNPQPLNQPIPIQPPQKPVAVTKTLPDIAQTVLYFAYPGVAIKDEDRAALRVLDGALSGIYYPGGRLHARLRDSQLVYGVHALELRGMDGGMFLIQAGTTREKRDEVRAIIEEEVQKIRNAPISQEELARAKGMAITAQAVDLQTNAAQADDAAIGELLDRGYKDSENYQKEINAVTVEDVQRVAQKYLRPQNSVLAIVEPKE